MGKALTARVHEAEARARRGKYPMCTRLSSVSDERSGIMAFLEWLADNKIELARERRTEYGLELAPILETKEKLLMQYFEIDEQKLEEERRLILDEQRELNDKKA